MGKVDAWTIAAACSDCPSIEIRRFSRYEPDNFVGSPYLTKTNSGSNFEYCLYCPPVDYIIKFNLNKDGT